MHFSKYFRVKNFTILLNEHFLYLTVTDHGARYIGKLTCLFNNTCIFCLLYFEMRSQDKKYLGYTLFRGVPYLEVATRRGEVSIIQMIDCSYYSYLEFTMSLR